MWHMPPGILISLHGLAALMYLWYTKPAHGVYKQANFSQIHQYRLDSCLDIPSYTSLDFSTACFSWRSHSQSTRACSTSLSTCQWGDRRLRAHKSALEAYRKLPWEQYYRHRRSIHCAHSRGTVTLVTARSVTQVYHYGPRKSLSSCPLKRHISTCLCTTNSTLIVPTQEAHQHSPLHY